MRVSYCLVLGTMLVNAHKPTMYKTFAWGNLAYGCGTFEETGCENLNQAQCQVNPGGEFSGEECTSDDTAICMCNTQFVQPKSPLKPVAQRNMDSYADAGYSYSDDAPRTPCGDYDMFKWNEEWIIDGQSGTISMDATKKNILNADYYDCINNEGEWRAAQGASDWSELTGTKYCRVMYDWEDKSKSPVDSFLCKSQCTDDCPPLTPEGPPTCKCDEGTPVETDCFSKDNHQCATCAAPLETPIGFRNGKSGEVRCEAYDPFHLVDCGRDPTHGFRIVSKAELPPYSLEMCAYWAKQDPLCEGDYFYSFNHLDATDFSEEVWPEFKSWMTERGDNRSPEDWEEERQSFVQAEIADASTLDVTKTRSSFKKHKQKQYGCWCRSSETHKETKYNVESYKQQNETWFGYTGNTYKFNSANEQTDNVGPLLATDANKGCNHANYKITAMTTEWKCPTAVPKPIFGWILSPANVVDASEGCIAKTTFLRRNVDVANVINVPNGQYSFLCYASDLGKYKIMSEEMRSWLPGDLSIGTKFNHAINHEHDDNTCGGANVPRQSYNFKQTYSIDNQTRPMWFIIRKWEFKDGRMYFRGNEQVPDDYEVTEDPRWKDCKGKFMKAAPLVGEEIVAMRLVMKKVVRLALNFPPLSSANCKTAEAREAIAKMAKDNSKNGLEYPGEEFWAYYMVALGHTSQEKGDAMCGDFDHPLAERDADEDIVTAPKRI